ncbi:branched-chain amino acid ABC transporter permease [Lentilitoribacter sp. EG35]|jgi:branched-chain amino acid transport system permease protein|uniref:branched-chain amino acid ABC transporter permease n=1 Tax=Lentilitoribacter sp. EG35 TaxID=3234192 RepID=UPI00345F859B
MMSNFKGATRNVSMFAIMAVLFIVVGQAQSWPLALTILNLCLISSIMALGVNIQWGYAGLLNVGVMGFAALGGVAAVLVSSQPVPAAWEAGGSGILLMLLTYVVAIALITFIYFKLKRPLRGIAIFIVAVIGYFVSRSFYDPASVAIEAVDSAATGNLGGLGLPIMLSWLVGGLFAAAAAWVVGKISLGLRSDYLAIATLGISEIIIAFLKNEDWLTRGVKNVTGLPRPVPYEVDIQQSAYYQQLASDWGMSIIDLSSVVVKLCYAGLFAVVLLALLYLAEKALRSPWGRMMRAIRDNETAAEAMGKNVKGRHLQVFILGSAVIGIAGAMLTTLDGQFTPGSYQPLRFTFLIWVMVIVGGSGNNWGAILGGFVIWFFWVEAEPLGLWLMDTITSGMADDSPLREHLLKSAAHMRLMTMGVILLLVLRFTPRGLIPERKA